MFSACTKQQKAYQTWPLRGRRSRNKVSVGEPAEGSLLLSLSKQIEWCYQFQGSTLLEALPLTDFIICLYGVLLLRFLYVQVVEGVRRLDRLTYVLVMDVSARATMKDAAKCAKLCEWQNLESQ